LIARYGFQQMPKLPTFPRLLACRAALGVTQILAWGTIYYTPVLTVPLIAAEHAGRRALPWAGSSLALDGGAGVAAGRRLVDRYGGHRDAGGSLVGALDWRSWPMPITRLLISWCGR
jgi:hypothetical protein